MSAPQVLLSLLPPTALAVALLGFPGWAGRGRPSRNGLGAMSSSQPREGVGVVPVAASRAPQPITTDLSTSRTEEAFALLRQHSAVCTLPILDLLQKLVALDRELIIELRQKIELLERLVALGVSEGDKTP